MGRDWPEWKVKALAIVIALLIGCVGITLVEIFDSVG